MAGDLPQFPSLRPCEMAGWRQLLLFSDPRPPQDPRTWAGPAARPETAVAGGRLRARPFAGALPAARRPRKRWRAGKLQPKRGQARTWKFCSHFKIVARARHAQCSICNKCIRPFTLVERCARHMKQFRQPKAQVGPDSWSDRRDDEGDDEFVTEAENLFCSSYEGLEKAERAQLIGCRMQEDRSIAMNT